MPGFSPASSGVLQVLIFPKPALYILSWVALAPLIYAILQCRDQDVTAGPGRRRPVLAPATAWQGFLLGYACGLIWYLGSCYWILPRHALLRRRGRSVVRSCCCDVRAVSRPLSRTVRAAARADRRAAQRIQPARAGVRALRGSPVELARTYITGFPWDLLGTTQIDNIPLSRIATVTGVYGISFEIALVNTAVAAAFLVPRDAAQRLAGGLADGGDRVACRQAGAPSRRSPATHGAPWCSRTCPFSTPSDWTLDYLQQTLDSLAALSVRPQHSKPGAPGLIMWPESPAPFFATDLHVRHTLAEVARNTNSYIIAGSHRHRARGRSEPPARHFQLGLGDRAQRRMDRALRQDPPGAVRRVRAVREAVQLCRRTDATRSGLSRAASPRMPLNAGDIESRRVHLLRVDLPGRGAAVRAERR